MKRVYFLKPEGAPGPIKIGYSDAPKYRAKQITMDTKVPVEIMAEVQGDNFAERDVHRKFAEWRAAAPFEQNRDYIIGAPTEWFEPTDELMAFIAEARRLGRLPLADHERADIIIPAMRASGATWAAIGLRFGHTRQWAEQMHKELDRRAKGLCSSRVARKRSELEQAA